VALLEDIFQGSESVLTIGLGGATDGEIWDYAVAAGCLIVSKDLDFAERALLASTVKVVWLRLGNCTTASVHLILRNSVQRLAEFVDSNDILLELP